MKWIRDEDFIRGKIPMTKFEVRSVTMAVLEITPEDTLLDVGAGTGSISLQAAVMGAKVYSIEVEEEGCELIKKNAEKFGVTLNVIRGKAPDAISEIPNITKCFIGGSKGKLKEIIERVDVRLAPGGIIVANFIKPDNMITFTSELKKQGYQNTQSRLIQTSVTDRLGLLKAQNPVFIVEGTKPE